MGDRVRLTVGDTLNTLLDEEADRLTYVSRYERTEGRLDIRAGSYLRKLLKKAGEVELEMPRRWTLLFEPPSFGAENPIQHRVVLDE